MNKKLLALKERYLNLFEEIPSPSKLIQQTEKDLNIVLPQDFKYISKFYSGGLLGIHSLFSFIKEDQNDYNVVDKTLFYRGPTFGLPERYVALEETDTSFIVMETKASPDKKTPVIYCSIPDAYNLAEEKPLQYKHHFFPSFTDFFDYLLTEEEKERGLISIEV